MGVKADFPGEDLLAVAMGALEELAILLEARLVQLAAVVVLTLEGVALVEVGANRNLLIL